jgi:DNA-binding beta-propeller fold protein YncE
VAFNQEKSKIQVSRFTFLPSGFWPRGGNRFFLAFILVLSLTGLFTGFLLSSFTEASASTDVNIADSKMRLVKTITGNIAPKSVRASSNGLISAQNMMYRHSVTIYDAKNLELKATIPDTVDLNKFGFRKSQTFVKGSPVEGAFSSDDQYLYVTNYAMYGKGFNREGTDKCSPKDKYDRSFLYRINTTTFDIDAIYRVGVVPKVVEITPDNRFALVSNWCSYDLTVISLEEQRPIRTIPIGAYPRGIAVTNDSKFAFVAQMGGSLIHKVNLMDFSKSVINVGANPRALQISADNKILFATLNVSGQVIAVDLEREKVVKRIKTGEAARSLALSSDGSALFVVNYNSDTLAKVRVSDFKILQKIKVCDRPIGITYEKSMNQTWVACYGGSIKVYSNIK